RNGGLGRGPVGCRVRGDRPYYGALDLFWPFDTSGLDGLDEPPSLDLRLSAQLLSQHRFAVLELPQRDIGPTAHKMDANESPVCLLRRRVDPKQAIRQPLGCVQ